MGFKSFFDGLRSSPATTPHLISISNLHVDPKKEEKPFLRFSPNDTPKEGLEGPFVANEHYFTVRVNEMFLSSKRKWLTEIEPNVICLTSYNYGQQEIDNPFIVGRGMTKIKEIPQGMVFYDTRVAGVHPFIGGRLTISLVLCQSEVKNYLTQGIQFIENVSGVFGKNISKLLGNYVEVANLVIGAVDKLFDSKDLQPLFGFSKQFDVDAGDNLEPGYYVLMDSSSQDWDSSELFVVDNHLYIQKENNKAVEFRNDEYILFSLTRSDKRGDLRNLPYYKSYDKILDELKVPEVNQDLKDKIKGMLRVLNIEMYQSPDLTKTQSKALIESYVKDVQELMEPKINFGVSKSVKKADILTVIDEKIAQM